MKTVIWLMVLAMSIQLVCLAAESVNVRVSVIIPELPKIAQDNKKDNSSVPGNQNESPAEVSEITTLTMRNNRQVLLKTQVTR
jgi:hypothetical protein